MYNYIDGDFFESLSDYSYSDMYSSNMSNPNYLSIKNIIDKIENPIFFIETGRIGYLFNEINKFSQKVSIICHNSDITFGKELLDNTPKNVDKLWCQNYNYIETDVLKSLPIGLERVRWFPEQKKQEVLFNECKTEFNKDNLIYMNFNINTNKDRINCFNHFKDKNYVTTKMVGNGGDYKSYIYDLKKHKYVISPFGNGIDCHRNWEAINMGCIPIVLNCYFNINMYSDMPVLIVDKYEDLDKNILEKIYDNIINKNKEKQYINYWNNIIKNNEHR